MNQPIAPPRPALTQELQLLRYLKEVIRYRLLIAIASISLGITAFVYSLTLPDLYETFARTDLVNLEDPGGVSPDNRRASEVLTLVEHGFVLGTTKDNYLDVMLAKLRSRNFTMQFIEQHNLNRYFFAEFWDERSATWINGFEPNRSTAFKLFQTIRFIDHNPETDIISIRFRWTNPVQARDWANQYVADFNQYMRAIALEEVARKQHFLQTELARARVVDIQQSIYRLIEAQMAVAMLANSREDYVLEVIDEAILPLDRYSPGRKSYLILGCFAGLMLSIAFVIAKVLLGDLRTALQQHQIHPQT